MITLITGLPGSCKSLYTVDKLLQPLMTATIKHTGDDGEEREYKRRVFTNINGLLLEHEKITLDQLKNWHEWAKPGDVIVPDEVQKEWPLAATGSKVPACIEALETHRHMGVDFIVITQHPMLIHVNITRLVGRHLHMRRLGNMGFATVYEWDGCSRTLLYKNCMAKFPYRFSKKAFALYKSAEVHTKSPRKLPSLIYGVGFGAVALAFFAPTVTARLNERLNPPTAQANATAAAKSAPASAESLSPGPAPSESLIGPPVAPASVATIAVAGCAVTPTRCTCYDSGGVIVSVPEAQCRAGGVTAGLKLAGAPLDLSGFFPDAPVPDEGDPVQAFSDGRIVNAMRAGSPIH